MLFVRGGLPPLLLFLVTVASSAFPSPAAARSCGDDVGGRRVACACGDVVVSSVRLRADDPIAQAPCPAGGLLVDVPVAHASPVVDLGTVVLGGSGRGVGIEVVAGGRHGATLVGPGTVRGFDLGVVAREGSLAAASAVRAEGNVRDGFRIAGDDYRLLGCVAARNGRDGFVLHGAGHRLDDCTAEGNARDGIVERGRPAADDAATNTTAANGRRDRRARGARAR